MFQRLIGFASQGAATQITNDATSEPTGAKNVLDRDMIVCALVTIHSSTSVFRD